jgi:hypothetical protein
MKQDIVGFLRGLWLATLAARGNGEYTRGFLAALVVVAATFGIQEHEVTR